MQVSSYRSAGAWCEVKPPQTDDDDKPIPDEALGEISRSLSDCFRCNNLVVLTGLGTSLHVNIVPPPVDKPFERIAQAGKKIAPTMGDLWTAVNAVDPTAFAEALKLSKFPPAAGENIETLLSYCKVAAEFIDDENDKSKITTFIKLAEDTVRDQVRFLDADDDLTLHADFLRRLARRSSRKVRSKVFTTNYDLCFEYAARKGRYVVVDGFSHTTPQVFDSIFFSYDVVKRDSNPDSHDFIPNVFQLYKLHGSADWTKNQKTKEIEKDPKSPSPLLVYPRNTKYELAFEQPYLEMMSAFQAALRQPDTGLLILGFGFNDNHIAEPILSAINSNLHLKVAICDPALGPREVAGVAKDGSEVSNPHLSKIQYLIKNGDARLALISGLFKDIVPLLPDIAAQTDLEQHMDRVRQLRGITA
ncbi:MAG: SIR2 family protein [Burkholderiales bacterium]